MHFQPAHLFVDSLADYLVVLLGCDARGPLLLDFLLDLLLAILFELEGVGDAPDLAVEAAVDEEAVHVSAEEGRTHEVVDAELLNFLAGEELVVFVHALGVAGGVDLVAQPSLLELLGDAVKEGAPAGRRAKRGGVKGLAAGLLPGAQ